MDDGSTDGGAAVVGGYTSPLIRLVTQKNAGVSAARNRGAVLARSEYIAFLDADDRWQPGYLEKMAFLIEQYPDCGAYAAAFDIVSGDRIYSNVHPAQEGIVPDFFRGGDAFLYLPALGNGRSAWRFQELGGFPEGMKIGEDLYFWIRLASRYRICFTPENLVFTVGRLRTARPESIHPNGRFIRLKICTVRRRRILSETSISPVVPSERH